MDRLAIIQLQRWGLPGVTKNFYLSMLGPIASMIRYIFYHDFSYQFTIFCAFDISVYEHISFK